VAQRVLSNAGSDNEFYLNSLSSFKSLFSNLTSLYENLKLRLKNLKSLATSDASSFNGGQDVDERLFLENDLKSERNDTKHDRNRIILSMVISTPSSNLDLLIELRQEINLENYHESDTNDTKSLIEILKKNEFFCRKDGVGEEEEGDDKELLEFVAEFVMGKCASTMRGCLVKELEMVGKYSH